MICFTFHFSIPNKSFGSQRPRVLFQKDLKKKLSGAPSTRCAMRNFNYLCITYGMMENERDVVYDFYIQMLKSFCNGGKFLKLFILNFKIWQNKKIFSRGGFSFKILDF